MTSTRFAAAAVAAGVLAGGLLAPAHAADAKPVFVGHLVGTASCLGPGSIRFAVASDESGALRGEAAVTDIRNGPWSGSVTLVTTMPADLPDGGYDSTEILPTKRYVVRDGRIAASASAPAAPPAGQIYVLDPLAQFDLALKDDCTVGLAESRGRYDLMGAEGNLSLNAHRSIIRVDPLHVRAGHRYREVITAAHRNGSIAHRTIERTATTSTAYSGVDLSLKGLRLASFRRVSVRIVDLNDRSVDPITMSIAR